MKLLTFKKGVHPSEFKDYTCFSAIEQLPIPDEVFIPLQQHIGAPCDPLVKKGDEVKTGQVIGKSKGFVSSPVHSSVTGKVKAVSVFNHPLGTKAEMIHIKRSGEDEWDLMTTPENWKDSPIADLKTLIRDAGLVGMGGAAFPTHVKLSPPADKKIDSFILNGCECEPFLTSDHRTMLEMSEKVITGMAILMKVLGTKDGCIGIENNKTDAIELITKKVKELGYDFKVIPLQVKYPQGAEKMLIDAVLQRQVPTGGLPMDVGAVVNNVGTAVATAEAVTEGKALIHRIVTVTGDGVNDPKNLDVRIGTPFKVLLDHCGEIKDETVNVLNGGPMMGISQWDLSVPVIKSTSGIVCETSLDQIEREFPCIRCGNCVTACPMFLLPTRLARYTEMEQYNAADELGILNCVECGSCAFGCPAQIPLVQWIRIGKLRIGELKRKQAS